MSTRPTVPGITHTTINANGIDIHIARAGQGKPLVLLHGWPEFWYVWHKLVPLLGDRFDLIMLDLRGFGETQKPYRGKSDKNTAEVMSDDLMAMADALDLRTFGLVSHDIGSLIARVAAGRVPDRLTGLFFFDCVYPGIGNRWALPDHLGEIWYQSFHQQDWAADMVGSSRDACRTYFKHFLSHWSARPDAFDDDLEAWVDNFMAPGNLQGGFNWYASVHKMRLAIMKGLAPKPQPIDLPTYVYWGAHDPVLKAEWADNIPEYFPNATVEVAEDAGHFVHYETPAAAAERIARFFAPLG